MFLVLTVREGAEQDALGLLADLPGLIRSVRFRRPEDNLTCIAGIGARAWDRMYDVPRPPGLHVLPEIVGDRHTAVSTPGDLLFHLRADRVDLCFELARQLMLRLSGVADVVDEVLGFRYFDNRDLLGFVDGTENPEGTPAAAAVFVAEEDSAYGGSSYVIVQKYLHDLATWNAISVREQELVIGRSKVDDIELPDADKPSNSHVELNTIVDDDGTEHDIVRDNMAFGEIGSEEFGTYFIGYAADPSVTEQMLRNMFVGKPPGNHDRILDFSTAVTGSLFFVPTTDFLESGPPEAQPEVAPAPSTTEQPAGSLQIGSLREQNER
ncbi:Dyp-type peroxidase [Flexivirga caeni]|uniref:Dyp-type peroxidase n=2 Tax=Flexivirga caeni TaxID=2294115 RepID=A0A3M9MEJ2_9MICO|nr:Dyp-type peroxidase [Flexivirga caeni]